jgi:hypothetical protein
MVQKTACMLDSGKDFPTEIKCSASNTCHSRVLATYEPNTEDYGDSRTEDNEEFRYEWNKLSAENDVNFTFPMYV